MSPSCRLRGANVSSGRLAVKNQVLQVMLCDRRSWLISAGEQGRGTWDFDNAIVESSTQEGS